jgi:hypothetical protein
MEESSWSPLLDSISAKEKHSTCEKKKKKKRNHDSLL